MAGNRKTFTKKVLLGALTKHDGNITRSAAYLHAHRDTVRRLMEEHSISREDLAKMGSEAPERKPLDPIERHDAEHYKKRVKTLEKELAYVTKLRESVIGLASAPQREGAPWLAKPAGKRRTEMPLLFTSDLQYGEVILADELDGVNEFNTEIARRRYRQLIHSTIDICMNYRHSERYPGIILLRGGDSISGDIHDELIQTNEVPSTMQVAELFEEEREGIRQLKKVFGKVQVLSVPGNHGRLTKKPVAKKYVEWNFDHLLTLMLERAFDGDKDVTFTHPKSGDIYFDVFGTKLLLTHGDRIGSRGGQGFIGASATVGRGSKKTRDAYATLGKRVDWLLMGHFHEFMVLPSTIVNGSLPGYSEFAAANRMRPEAPSQALFFIDSQYGLNEIRRVILT